MFNTITSEYSDLKVEYNIQKLHFWIKLLNYTHILKKYKFYNYFSVYQVLFNLDKSKNLYLIFNQGTCNCMINYTVNVNNVSPKK